MPTVDLIIPALNEEANIARLLAELPREQLRHVIVCDNGSTDRTPDLAREAGAIVVHEPQRGYGAACLAGLAWIAQQDDKPDAVAFMDADLADDPTLLPQVFGPVLAGDADLMVASRRKLAEPGSLTLPQRFGNRLSTVLIQLLTGLRSTDMGPMRAIRYGSLVSLGMEDRTWGWMVEMQYKAAVAGLRYKEIDVPYRCRAAGESKISGSLKGSAKAGAKILSMLAELAWRHRRGRLLPQPDGSDR